MTEEVLKLITPYTGEVHSWTPIDAGYRADATLSVQAAQGAEADLRTMDTLATVLLRMHSKWERERPGWRDRFPEGSWLRKITPAVEAWAEYRGVGA